VEKINLVLAAQGMPVLNFGIAVHAGEVVYGNLASDTLIDPTIIGIHVNKTARLEEMTKVPGIKALIGNNAVILSEEMVEYGRNFLPRGALVPINLADLGIHVRDFQDVQRVYALTYDKAQQFYGRAMEHIQSQRLRLPASAARTDVNSYRGVSYYYQMQDSGPNTSWLMLIDVDAMPQRAVQLYAEQALDGLDFQIVTTDARWLVVSTGRQAGQLDETDVENFIFRTIEGLQQTIPN
ncbi:MAG TPA: hypothetical protein VL359_14925, partial [bacterium]|nr:hypothetical protein [bacterium]